MPKKKERKKKCRDKIITHHQHITNVNTELCLLHILKNWMVQIPSSPLSRPLLGTIFFPFSLLGGDHYAEVGLFPPVRAFILSLCIYVSINYILRCFCFTVLYNLKFYIVCWLYLLWVEFYLRKFLCWSPNTQYLRMRPYLEKVPLQMWLVELRHGRTGVGWVPVTGVLITEHPGKRQKHLQGEDEV